MLWPICQRYNLKAIHNYIELNRFNLLLWPICQRYNLKAIHNAQSIDHTIDLVVTNMSKIQSESNSQLNRQRTKSPLCCDQYVKDTIWKQFTTWWPSSRCMCMLWPICQRYNLKAIHNCRIAIVMRTQVVTNMSKIQSESNSQQIFPIWCRQLSCDQYVKDTIWKQFTTRLP